MNERAWQWAKCRDHEKTIYLNRINFFSLILFFSSLEMEVKGLLLKDNLNRDEK